MASSAIFLGSSAMHLRDTLPRGRRAALVLTLGMAACARATPPPGPPSPPTMALAPPAPPSPPTVALAPPASASAPVDAPSAQPSVTDAEAEADAAADVARARLEDFLRRYPDDERFAPDAMMRLAFLTDEPAKELALLDDLVAHFPAYPQRTAVELERARLLLAEGRDRKAAMVLSVVTCFERTPTGLSPVAGCSALPGARDEDRGRAFALVGDGAFEAGDALVADEAYTEALPLVPNTEELWSVVAYKLAWSRYRRTHYARALEPLARMLSATAGALRDEAIELAAMCLSEPDWDDDGHPDVRYGVRRQEVRTFVARHEPWVPAVLERTGDMLVETTDYGPALDAYDLLLRQNPQYAAAERVRASMARARQLASP